MQVCEYTCILAYSHTRILGYLQSCKNPELHLASTWAPPGLHLDSTWFPDLHLASTWAPPGFWTSTWLPLGLHLASPEDP